VTGSVAHPPDEPEEIDCLGQRCPAPVIALARRITEVPVGTVVRVLADDPAAATDIPAWCRLRAQEFLGTPAAHTFDVRRIA
jgi:tRNA 2-thiouridine synthesizing protein A